MIVREIFEGRSRTCEQILRSLPDWFGIEEVLRNYVREVEAMPTLVAVDADVTVGFLALHFHNAYTAEIHVMGVLPQAHRRGVGRKLLADAESLLVAKGFEFLSVKTVSPAAKNPEYERTLQFYLRMGFRPVEEFKTLWGEANPCLLLIKSLGA